MKKKKTFILGLLILIVCINLNLKKINNQIFFAGNEDEIIEQYGDIDKSEA